MEIVAQRSRKKQAEDSKNRIYEVAIRLIADKGFEGVGIKEIVEKAGVSVGAFYHHFGSKDGILEENFRRADELFLSFAHDSLPDAGAKDRIVAYLLRYADLVETDTGIELSKRLYSPMNKLFVRSGRAMQTELAGIIEEGARRGELSLEKSAADACEMLFIGARGIVFHWCLKDGSFDLKTAMREYTLYALKALSV